MTKQKIAEATMQSIKVECKSCHELLVEGLTKINTIKAAEFKGFGYNPLIEKDIKEIHNYNPVAAYDENISYKRTLGIIQKG